MLVIDLLFLRSASVPGLTDRVHSAGSAPRGLMEAVGARAQRVVVPSFRGAFCRCTRAGAARRVVASNHVAIDVANGIVRPSAPLTMDELNNETGEKRETEPGGQAVQHAMTRKVVRAGSIAHVQLIFSWHRPTTSSSLTDSDPTSDAASYDRD